MNAIEQEFQKQINAVYEFLQDIVGKKVDAVLLIPAKDIPEEHKGIFQLMPLIGIRVDDKVYALNVERILTNIWNKTKTGEI